jgi:hypothetical protein
MVELQLLPPLLPYVFNAWRLNSEPQGQIYLFTFLNAFCCCLHIQGSGIRAEIHHNKTLTWDEVIDTVSSYRICKGTLPSLNLMTEEGPFSESSSSTDSGLTDRVVMFTIRQG